MFIVVCHHYGEPEDFNAFFDLATKQPIPMHIVLHGVYPATDRRHAFCLWEAEDQRQVQDFLERAFGRLSRNEYMEINEAMSLGLINVVTHEIKLQSEKKQAELEMQTLRAQMNPHFIFNSLNSINRFILTNDRSGASAYLTKFSKLIRLILQHSAAQFISLAGELEALRLYLELESLRFGEQFSYRIVCDQELEQDFIKMPPLLLQPYIENAIWHGLMHKSSKGHLLIDLRLDYAALVCTIRDDGIGRKKAAELNSKSAAGHKSMGMNITEQRLAMMEKTTFRGDAIVIRDLMDIHDQPVGTEVVLTIPIFYD